MTLDLVLQILLTALLAVTVVYCYRLDKRLRILRSGQDGLREVVEQLNAATVEAGRSIELLRGSSVEIGEELDKRMRSARALLDELSLVVASGNNLAERLEARLTAGARAPAPGAAEGESRLLRNLREVR